jgi:hypothetical protein
MADLLQECFRTTHHPFRPAAVRLRRDPLPWLLVVLSKSLLLQIVLHLYRLWPSFRKGPWMQVQATVLLKHQRVPRKARRSSVQVRELRNQKGRLSMRGMGKSSQTNLPVKVGSTQLADRKDRPLSRFQPLEHRILTVRAARSVKNRKVHPWWQRELLSFRKGLSPELLPLVIDRTGLPPWRMAWFDRRDPIHPFGSVVCQTMNFRTFLY